MNKDNVLARVRTVEMPWGDFEALDNVALSKRGKNENAFLNYSCGARASYPVLRCSGYILSPLGHTGTQGYVDG